MSWVFVAEVLRCAHSHLVGKLPDMRARVAGYFFRNFYVWIMRIVDCRKRYGANLGRGSLALANAT
jgi:hypothetical protein